MNNEKTFKQWLREFFESFGQQTTPAKIQLWEDCLSAYPVSMLQRATVCLARDFKHGGGPLLPGSLSPYLPSQFGHPTAEIAWNHIPKGDSDGGFVTDQMMAALADCQSTLQRGDHIAARMAFNESYKARVRAAEAQGIAARFWFTSPAGLTHEQRLHVKETKALEAYRNGWLTHEKTKKLVVSISTELGQCSPQVLELLRDDEASMRLLTGITLQQTSKGLSSLPAPKSVLVDQYTQIKQKLAAEKLSSEDEKRKNEAVLNQRRKMLLAQATAILQNNVTQ